MAAVMASAGGVGSGNTTGGLRACFPGRGLPQPTGTSHTAIIPHPHIVAVPPRAHMLVLRMLCHQAQFLQNSVGKQLGDMEDMVCPSQHDAEQIASALLRCAAPQGGATVDMAAWCSWAKQQPEMLCEVASTAPWVRQLYGLRPRMEEGEMEGSIEGGRAVPHDPAAKSEALFEVMDTNGDGVIDKEEWQAAMETQRHAEEAAAGLSPPEASGTQHPHTEASQEGHMVHGGQDEGNPWVVIESMSPGPAKEAAIAAQGTADAQAAFSALLPCTTMYTP